MGKKQRKKQSAKQREEQNKEEEEKEGEIGLKIKSTIVPAKPINKQLYDFVVNKLFITNVTNVDDLQLI